LNITITNTRVCEVDVLRGVALLGIAVVNVPLFSDPWDGMPVVETKLDAMCAFIVGTFFTAKFFGLFAFLFGWSMVRMNQRAVDKGWDSVRIWRRRMFALFAIGLAHGILVFPFDILMLYGVLGLLLSRATLWSREKLTKHAMIGLLAAPFAYALLIWWYSASPGDDFDGEKYGLYTVAIAVDHNLWSLIFCQQVNLLYNGAMSYAAICLGILASREGFFEIGSRSFAMLEKHLPLLWGVGIALNLPNGILCALDGDSSVAMDAFAMGLVGLGAPWLTAAYVVTITRWTRRRARHHFFSAAGRMSMSAYVLEGILAGWVFYEYGLGWNMDFGAAATMACAMGIFLATKMFCMAWLRFHPHGPLEVLWRKMSYVAAAGVHR